MHQAYTAGIDVSLVHTSNAHLLTMPCGRVYGQGVVCVSCPACVAAAFVNVHAF